MLYAVQGQLTEYDYYKGYELDDICSYELSKHDKVALDNAIFLVDNKLSLRKCAKEVGRSKSSLSRDFIKLRRLSFDLYKVVQKQLRVNKERYFRRG